MSHIVYTKMTFILNLSSWILLRWCFMCSVLFLHSVKHLRCFPGKDSKHFHKKSHVAILKAKQVNERHMVYLWHEQSHYHWTICRNKAAHPKCCRKHENKHNSRETEMLQTYNVSQYSDEKPFAFRMSYLEGLQLIDI